MVARNYSPQELGGYGRLLQGGDVDDGLGEGEFLTLHHPHHQTHHQGHHMHQHMVKQMPEALQTSGQSQQQHQMHQQNLQHVYHQNQHVKQNHQFQQGVQRTATVQYYDLNSIAESPVSLQYLGGGGGASATGSATASMDTHPGVDSSSTPIHHHVGRKRKASYNETSDCEDDTGDSKSVRTNDDCRKQNHSEIEKRRRDKMNTYITELSAMVPMCHAMSRKLDKLTVLRMAVQHLKTIRGAAVHSYTEGHYKPAFLSDQELKRLILQAADGFLFVVGCDRGRILYVSESVSQVLNYSQGDLLGQSWFDILHPKDVAKVKEQLSSSDLSPRERLIDAKTMLPVKTDVPQGVSRLCPGARRSFFCRMKCKQGMTAIKEEADTTTGHHHHNSRRGKKTPGAERKYSVIHCTGYLKSWAPAKIGLDEVGGENEESAESCNLSCLVAVGRQISALNQMLGGNGGGDNGGGAGVGTGGGAGSSAASGGGKLPNVRPVQFVSRHAMDGKFLFVDQRATLVLGFLPQELLGTSMYEYYHHEDIPALADAHKGALQGPEAVTTDVYRFRTKEGNFVRIRSKWKSFRNPWTKDVEHLIAKNSVIFNDSRNIDSNGVRQEGTTHLQAGFDFFSQSNGREMQRMINTHVEASKIGRQIAEQVIDSQRRSGDSPVDSSPDPETVQAIPLSTAESLISTSISPDRERLLPSSRSSQNGLTSSYIHVRNNVILPNDPEGEEEIIKMMGGGVLAEPPGPSVGPTTGTGSGTTDGNDEAAMAVIMSLLEADAGLGGPVDFSGLPWPLP